MVSGDFYGAIGALDLGAADLTVRLVDDPKAQLEEMDFQDFEVVRQYCIIG